MKRVTSGPAAVFLLLVLWVSASAASTLTVAVKVRGQHPPDTALVEAATGATGAEKVLAEVALVNGRGEVSLQVEQAETWRLHAAADGYWSPEVTASAPAREPVELVLWPAVAAAASFRAPDDADHSDEVRLTLNQVPELPDGAPEQPESAEVRCPISEKKLAECKVPAGQWHLRIKVQRYVPIYRWNLQLEQGKKPDIGEIVLERGASLFGKVVTADGSPCPARTRVELSPLVARNAARKQLAEKIENLTETVAVNEWGYFHFDAVSPRTYQLTAVQDGFIPSTVPQVSVAAGQHVELAEPLVLQPALQLLVVVDPGEDVSGEPWSVSLLSWSPLKRGKITDGTTENGEWRAQDLTSGPYLVRVTDSQGNEAAVQEIELTEAEQTAWIELSYAHVSGKVVCGDEEPLAASLSFTADNTKVSAESDDEGRFEVMLPRPGQWLVRVRNEQENIDCGGIELDIEPEQTGEILIEVPDTRVHGRIVFGDGTPAADAEVMLINLADGSKAKLYSDRTDGDGEFEVRGLPPATYRIEAARGTLQSRIETAQVSENGSEPELILVLLDKWILKGRVVVGSEPVPAAHIWAIPYTEQGTLASSMAAQSRSNIDGSFSLAMADTTAMARVLTMAPGYILNAVTVTREQAESSKELAIRLDVSGGTLLLSRTSELGIIVLNGVPFSDVILSQWAMLNGRSRHPDHDPWMVPAMPPGAYGYCDLTREEALLVRAGLAVPTKDRCVEGVLSEGGTLTLSAPRR
jgi:hypothetical protein